VKERTDLIKNFPSIGPGSTSCDASALLGGTNSGTRFSELEHKLEQIEQGWKKHLPNENKTSKEFKRKELNLKEETSPWHFL
jgi:hypothetical protein